MQARARKLRTPRGTIVPVNSLTVSSAPEYGIDRLPEREAFRPFVRRQDLDPVRFAQTGQVRIDLPLSESFSDQGTVRRGRTLECRGQCRQVGAQPIACLLAPAQSLYLLELGCIRSGTAAGQRR